jgi:two-component sensor histidine kinase
MAAFGLAVFVAGWTYVLFGGTIGRVDLISNLLPMILAVTVSELVNAALVVGAVSLQTGSPSFEIWKRNVSWAIPMNLLSMAVGGGGLALGYEIAGVLGVGVFFLPISLTIYAFRLYVSQTKAQVEELESNIAERQRAEEQLKASLSEKEVLLQEIHHRVKNNLQIMSSLLYLQSKKVHDQDSFEMFMESRNRIRSMALVHEKLYQSTNLSQINFAQYVRSLANYLFRSRGVDPNVIRLRNDVDEVYLSIDTAVPCGLIINELVSNALQHAFPDGRKGEISIEFHPAQDDKFTLTVRDDGVGFPQAADLTTAESLGLQLVNTLVNQLEGTVEYDRNGGTTVKVVFAELTYEPGR